MKNYLIIEQGNEKECRIVESVILNDRYSLEHYWKKILQVFYNGQEEKYIHRLSIRYLKIPGKKTSGLYPRCYRNDSNLKCGNHCHCCPLNDIVYAFVIRNDTLRIYHYGTEERRRSGNSFLFNQLNILGAIYKLVTAQMTTYLIIYFFITPEELCYITIPDLLLCVLHYLPSFSLSAEY